MILIPKRKTKFLSIGAAEVGLDHECSVVRTAVRCTVYHWHSATDDVAAVVAEAGRRVPGVVVTDRAANMGAIGRIVAEEVETVHRSDRDQDQMVGTRCTAHPSVVLLNQPVLAVTVGVGGETTAAAAAAVGFGHGCSAVRTAARHTLCH